MAIEFALIGAASLWLVFEALQAGYYFYTLGALEPATAIGARAIMTGGVNSQNLTAAQFRTNLICPTFTQMNISCGNVIVNVQNIAEALSPGGFYSVVNSSQTALIQPPLNNSQTNFCPGISQSYVFVQVLYPMAVFSPVWRTFAKSYNGVPSYILQSTAAFRSEPFTSTSPSC